MRMYFYIHTHITYVYMHMQMLSRRCANQLLLRHPVEVEKVRHSSVRQLVLSCIKALNAARDMKFSQCWHKPQTASLYEGRVIVRTSKSFSTEP